MPDNEPLPTKHDIAKRYRLSLRKVDYLVAEGKLPFIEFGKRTKRFVWSDVEQAINDHLKVKAAKRS